MTSVNGPSIQDRFLSFGFDLVLIGPVISFLNSLLFLPMKGASELELATVTILTAMFFWCWIRCFFVAIGGATPGQRLMKLRLASVLPTSSRQLSEFQVEWWQILLREILWLAGAALFAAPFLSVFRHPERRCFHERWSRTRLHSNKDTPITAPTPAEIHLARILQMGSAMMFLVWISFVANLYFVGEESDLNLSGVSDAHRTSDRCEKIAEKFSSGSQALKQSQLLEQWLAFHEAGIVPEHCVKKAVDRAMYSQDKQDRFWALFANHKLFKGDQRLSRRYLQAACGLPESPASLCGAHLDDKAERGLASTGKTAPVLEAAQKLELDLLENVSSIENGLKLLKMSFPEGDFSKLGAKVCLAQLSSDCSARKISSCEENAEAIESRESGNRWKEEEALAWLEYQRCNRDPRGGLGLWKSLLAERPDIYRFARAVLGASDGLVNQTELVSLMNDRTAGDQVRARAKLLLRSDFEKRGISFMDDGGRAPASLTEGSAKSSRWEIWTRSLQ